MDEKLSLQDLATEARVTPRTVRYYISEGLLPSAERGPGAKYGRDLLYRLRLIRQLQRSHLPLAEIRRRLRDLTDEQVRELLDSPASQAAAEGHALDYVRSVLAERAVQPTMAAHAHRALATGPRAPALPADEEAVPPPYQTDRSHWERIVLSPDIELHVRRPLTRHQNRAVSRLIDHAHQLLEEDTP
jgi:DNA-binding transcriptional MerR regulator